MVSDFSELTFPSDRWYYINNTPYHFWLQQQEDFIILGLTDFFQKQIGEINTVTFNITLNIVIAKGKALAIIKAKNYSAILRFPFSCKVIEINESIKKNPKLINESPYEKSWLLKLNVDTPLDQQLTNDWINLSDSSNLEILKIFIDKEIKNKSLMADDCCPDFLGGSGVTRRRKT
jgi:glycine cleavage system H protein